MPRISPPTGGSYAQLEDHEPYVVELKDLAWTKSAPQYGEEDRMELTWLIDGYDEDDTLKDWLSLRLGQLKDGSVSKLRALLNALAGKPEATEIKWFDTDSLEWSYDGEAAAGQLAKGDKVVIRGKTVEKKDGGKRFNIEVYQAVGARRGGGLAAPPPPPPAPVQTFSQISEDGLFGWNGKEWIEIPQAAAPPPPPPAASSRGRSKKQQETEGTPTQAQTQAVHEAAIAGSGSVPPF